MHLRDFARIVSTHAFYEAALPLAREAARPLLNTLARARSCTAAGVRSGAAAAKLSIATFRQHAFAYATYQQESLDQPAMVRNEVCREYK